jgi:hypothetical protein
MTMRAALATALIAVASPGGAQDRVPPPWRDSALALVPPGYVAGEAYGGKGDAGYLAVYPAGADDPKSPGSVFTPRQVLVVAIRNGNAASVELKAPDGIPRGNTDTTQTDPNGTEEEFDKLHRELAANRPALPPGTEPCDLGAWSIDKDPKGLNVRAEPNTSARVLGTLPPPYRLKLGGRENTPPDGWLTEFKIIGYRHGWFLVEGATPPGKDYEDAARYPRNAPKPYAGRGWVAASRVGANFANGGTRMGGLFQAPHVDAKWTPVKDPQHGNEISADGGPQRLFACSGHWGMVEVHKVRGWWRSLCSNQVTNCS